MSFRFNLKFLQERTTTKQENDTIPNKHTFKKYSSSNEIVNSYILSELVSGAQYVVSLPSQALSRFLSTLLEDCITVNRFDCGEPLIQKVEPVENVRKDKLILI